MSEAQRGLATCSRLHRGGDRPRQTLPLMQVWSFLLGSWDVRAQPWEGCTPVGNKSHVPGCLLHIHPCQERWQLARCRWQINEASGGKGRVPNGPSSLSLSDVVLAGAPGSLGLSLALKELPARGDRAGCRHPGAVE